MIQYFIDGASFQFTSSNTREKWYGFSFIIIIIVQGKAHQDNEISDVLVTVCLKKALLSQPKLAKR